MRKCITCTGPSAACATSFSTQIFGPVLFGIPHFQTASIGVVRRLGNAPSLVTVRPKVMTFLSINVRPKVMTFLSIKYMTFLSHTWLLVLNAWLKLSHSWRSSFLLCGSQRLTCICDAHRPHLLNHILSINHIYFLQWTAPPHLREQRQRQPHLRRPTQFQKCKLLRWISRMSISSMAAWKS